MLFHRDSVDMWLQILEAVRYFQDQTCKPSLMFGKLWSMNWITIAFLALKLLFAIAGEKSKLVKPRRSGTFLERLRKMKVERDRQQLLAKRWREFRRKR